MIYENTNNDVRVPVYSDPERLFNQEDLILSTKGTLYQYQVRRHKAIKAGEAERKAL
jgi:hypothetical protein